MFDKPAVLDAHDIKEADRHEDPGRRDALEGAPVGAADRRAEGDAVALGVLVLHRELDIGEGRTEAGEALRLTLARQRRGGRGDMPPVARRKEVVQGRDIPLCHTSSTYRRRSALFPSDDMGHPPAA